MHLHDWFPTLPSYQAFNNRICLLSDTIVEFSRALLVETPSDAPCWMALMDSMPIVVAKSTRSGSALVAKGLCDKGYCSSKKMYFYGVKLHFVALKRERTLPIPLLSRVSNASENDLSVAKEYLPLLSNLDVYADKIYRNTGWEDHLLLNNEIRIFTPVKLKKGQKALDEPDRDTSRKISAIRQPIESFFAWLDALTNIQHASKVRSIRGLIAFLFARISVALLSLRPAFNP